MLLYVLFAVYSIACVWGFVYCMTLPVWCWIMEWAEIPCTFKEACVWNGLVCSAPAVFLVSAAITYCLSKDLLKD